MTLKEEIDKVWFELHPAMRFCLNNLDKGRVGIWQAESRDGNYTFCTMPNRDCPLQYTAHGQELPGCDKLRYNLEKGVENR